MQHLKRIFLAILFFGAYDLAQAAVEESFDDELDIQDQLIHAVDKNNKAKILGFIQQDPSLLLSLVENYDFLDNPDTTIHIFTNMKKAGVNLNYQDDDGDGILHVIIDTLICNIFWMPLVGTIFNKILIGSENQEYDLQNELFSDFQLVVKIKNTQKFVKALLKLGVKKHLQTSEDHQTAANILKDFIDEFESEAQDHKEFINELQKLYKILK